VNRPEGAYTGRVARRILGISAAPGWTARFESDGAERSVMLLAWALVEDDAGEQSLVGFVQRSRAHESQVGQVALADEVEGFAGYAAGALPTRASAEQH
jgi:hypothetical protein